MSAQNARCCSAYISPLPSHNPSLDCVTSHTVHVQVAVACGAESVLTAMLRPEWVSACVLDATDESEAQLTALDLAARPPANLDVIKCLLACGATPTSGLVQKLLRNCGDGGGAVASGEGGVTAVRECFLGAIAASEWAINPLIPGLKLYVAIIATKRQVLAACASRCDRVCLLGNSVLERRWDGEEGELRQITERCTAVDAFSVPQATVFWVV